MAFSPEKRRFLVSLSKIYYCSLFDLLFIEISLLHVVQDSVEYSHTAVQSQKAVSAYL